MKRMGGMSRSGGGRRRGGRPWGSNTQTGRGLMTAYTRPDSGSSMTMRIRGKAGRTNGVANLKGRASSKSYTSDPNVRRKKN